MLYQVPSGSKSAGGCATGWDLRNRLRFATTVRLPSGSIRQTPFAVLRRPCEQPAPEISAYIVSPMNAMSATPLTSLPIAGLVWLDGNPAATVVRCPSPPTFEIRPVKPPV
jgi:hypothetical protein